MDTIVILNSEIDQYSLHVPLITCKEKTIFEKAKNEITTNVDDLAFEIGNKKMHEEHPTSSYSAYSAEGTLKVSLDSPEQFSQT